MDREAIDREAKRLQERGATSAVAKRAVELLRACEREGIPPPSSLTGLLAAALGVASPQEPKWRAAIDAELTYPIRDNFLDVSSAPAERPTRASSRDVAKLTGVSHMTIQRWRKKPEYAEDLRLAALGRLANELAERMDRTDRSERPPLQGPEGALFAEARRRWVQREGPVTLPVEDPDKPGHPLTVKNSDELTRYMEKEKLIFAPEWPGGTKSKE